MYYVYELYHHDIIRNILQHFSNILCLNLNINNIILFKILVIIINKY